MGKMDMYTMAQDGFLADAVAKAIWAEKHRTLDDELSCLFTKASNLALQRNDWKKCLLLVNAAAGTAESEKQDEEAGFNAATMSIKVHDNFGLDIENVAQLFRAVEIASYLPLLPTTVLPDIKRVFNNCVDEMARHGMRPKQFARFIRNFEAVPAMPEMIACAKDKLLELHAGPPG